MFGTLRLVLALVVVLFHAGVPDPWPQTGVAAVAVFYMVSGFAMTGLLDRHFADGGGGIGAFYRDRLLRILPQYYVHLAFYTAVIVTLGPVPYFQYGTVDATVVIGYLTVVPLCFFLYSASLSTYMIIPQAWSLGTELLFYAIFPWLLRGRNREVWWTVACLAAFVAATHGLLDRDSFAYRIPPGPMLFFMIGHFLQRRRAGPVLAALGVLAVNAAALAVLGELTEDYNLELHAAAFLGAAVIAPLGHRPPGPLDEALGAASYGCYLVHFAILFIAEDLGLGDALPFPAYVAGVAAASVLAGHAAHLWVERPFASLRRSLRGGWNTGGAGLKIPTH